MDIFVLPRGLVTALRSWFHSKDRHIYLSNEQWIISRRLAWETSYSRFKLPGRVGFWPMDDVQRSTGNVYDASPQGRTLTRTGTVEYNLFDGLVAYADFQGGYLSRADETDLDVLGSETIYAANVRGLTVGGWFWLDTVQDARLIYKGTTAGNLRAYGLFSTGANIPAFHISSDGTAAGISAAQATPLAVNRWYFLVGRFRPQVEVRLFINYDEDGATTATTTGAIFNSSQGLAIGAQADGATLLNGRAAMCFLCAQALPDEMIKMLFEQTKLLFGYR